MAFELPALPYPFDALDPHIDAQTMEIHHDRHHATYVNNLNGAIGKHPELGEKSIEELLGDLNSVPEDVRTVVRNNGGGHLNHSIFWTIMGPDGGGEPSGRVAEVINSAFDDFAGFKDALSKAAVGQFGTGCGWAFLVGGKNCNFATDDDAHPYCAVDSGVYENQPARAAPWSVRKPAYIINPPVT